MSNQDNTEAGTTLPEFPVRRIRCALCITEVEVGDDESRVTGTFKMETMESFDFWFSYSTKFRQPTLGGLDRSPKINDGLKKSVKRRVLKALRILGHQYEGVNKAPVNTWLKVTVEEEDFFA